MSKVGTSDITDRLITACNGAPATIPWPHRLLHDAVAEIRDLRVELADARNEALDEAVQVCEDYSANHGTGMFDVHSNNCAIAILALIDKPTGVTQNDQPK